ncbi:MAG TPA: dihydropteroate synthase [Actinomycetes bacterium]|nr:dihydropteroate synthase [Actinomycetes bacterium]
MTVLNVTPDSFSDGGRYLDLDAAVTRATEQSRLGADLVDVGGESTRPGAERVPLEEELSRVVPVIKALAAQGIAVSVDTMRAEVAKAALDAGAVLINDVSGGLADPDMLPFAASVDVPIVLMHWRGHSKEMQTRSHYPRGVVVEVLEELSERRRAAEQAGVSVDRIVLDPGLGFAKEAEHNWSLLRALPRLIELGQPVLVGASRKRFLGALLGEGDQPRSVAERDDATLAITALAAAAGAWCVRVHDARGNVDAVRVAQAWGDAE